jgi:hypothetical protein
MLNVSAALSRRLLPQLVEEPPRPEGLRTWLEKGSFFIDEKSGPENLHLKNITLTELIPYLAHDYERFALSSFESLLFCSPEYNRPKAVGWPLLKIYYSAFFGAHAIMRATGNAILRIETRQAKRISEIASIFSPTLTITAGVYYFRMIQNIDNSIDVQLNKIADSGGAHDQFWKQFYSFLSTVTTKISENNEPDASAIVREIFEIQRLLSDNSRLPSGTWLSATRNNINYQHRHGVWFPYKLQAEASRSVSQVKLRDSLSIRLDYDTSYDPIQAFCACCHVIATISIDLSAILGKRTKNRRFIRLWNRLKSEVKGGG